jgi:hypothetical protein
LEEHERHLRWGEMRGCEEGDEPETGDLGEQEKN